MPTPSPGCHFVPRWRTMILPARTRWPPDFLTPSLRPIESRPLRDEPPAFLCAMGVVLYFFFGLAADFLAGALAACLVAGFLLAGLASAFLAAGFFSVSASPFAAPRFFFVFFRSRLRRGLV